MIVHHSSSWSSLHVLSLAVSHPTSSPRSETIPILQNNERTCACKTYRGPLPSHKNSFFLSTACAYASLWLLSFPRGLPWRPVENDHLSTRHSLEVPRASWCSVGGVVSSEFHKIAQKKHTIIIIHLHESWNAELPCWLHPSKGLAIAFIGLVMIREEVRLITARQGLHGKQQQSIQRGGKDTAGHAIINDTYICMHRYVQWNQHVQTQTHAFFAICICVHIQSYTCKHMRLHCTLLICIICAYRELFIFPPPWALQRIRCKGRWPKASTNKSSRSAYCNPREKTKTDWLLWPIIGYRHRICLSILCTVVPLNPNGPP